MSDAAITTDPLAAAICAAIDAQRLESYANALAGSEPTGITVCLGRGHCVRHIPAVEPKHPLPCPFCEVYPTDPGRQDAASVREWVRQFRYGN